MASDKIVRIQTKGMVTIPVEFRDALGIDEQSLLQAKIIDGGVFFMKIDYRPVSGKDASEELYSDKQIQLWMDEDKIDPRTAAKLKKLLDNPKK